MINSALTGSAGMTKAGNGTLTLGGANTYTGGTLVSGGRLAGSTTSLQGNITNNAAVTFTQTANGTNSGVISGSGSLAKEGTGTVTLSGANTYSGGTLISAGRLVGNTTSLQGAITNNAALTFDQSTNGTYAGVLSGSGSLLKTNAGTLTLSGNSSSYGGAVTIAAGAVRVANAGALGNTTGSTTVSSGAALELTASPGAEAISLAGTGLNSGGALRNISGNNTLSGLLTLTAATRINSDAGTLTLDVASGAAITGTHNLTIGGAGSVTIADNVNIATGTLTKDGAGVLTLSGVNTYTGATTINDGTLNVSGSTAAGSAVAVNSGGTLGGGGTVGGAVTINSGGTVSPGTSPGTLTVGSMTFEGGGHYNWQLFDATGAAGTGWDLINATGAFTFNNSSGNRFNINLWTLSAVSPDASGNATNFSGTNNYSWLIAQSGSVISGFDAATFNINTAANNGTDGFANPFTGTFSLSLDEAETGILLSYVGAAPAATNAWTGGGTGMGSAWRSGANWGAGVIPATNAIDEFGAAGVAGIGINMNQASGLQQVGRVDLTGGVDRRLTNSSGVDGTFQINGVGGKLLVNSTAANSLTLSNGTNAMDVRFASAGEIEVVNSGAAILIGSTIIGTNGFTKTGAGTLQLTASNSFTGNVIVSGGTLSLDANGALAANSNITINAGGTLRSGVAGLTNAINEAAALTVAGNGIINLAGGTERIGSIASGSSAASLVIGDSGANSGSLTVGDGTSTTFEGVISGTRAGAGPILTKTGNGTLTLAGANTFAGAVHVLGGTLAVGADAGLGQSTNLVLLSNNTAALRFTDSFASARNITVAAGTTGSLEAGEGTSMTLTGSLSKDGSVLRFGGGGTFTVTGQITGPSPNSDLLVDGSTVVLSNTNSYVGPTIITNGGTLVLAVDDAMPSGSDLILGGGTFLVDVENFNTDASLAFGSLTLTENSTIDLGDFGASGLRNLVFVDSELVEWTNDRTLTIANWQGVAQAPSEVTRLLFGTEGLTESQLGQIRFTGFADGGLLLGDGGELTPIPEAPVVWGAVAVTGFIFWRERRRLLTLFGRGLGKKG
jgi:autotransporter-associated beta strand protein